MPGDVGAAGAGAELRLSALLTMAACQVEYRLVVFMKK